MFSSLEALNDDAIEAPPAHISTRAGSFRPKAKPRGSKGAPVSVKRLSSPPAPASRAQSEPSSSIQKSTKETPDVGSAAEVSAQLTSDIFVSRDTSDKHYLEQNLDDAVRSYDAGHAEGVDTPIIDSLLNVQEERMPGKDMLENPISESSTCVDFKDGSSLFDALKCTSAHVYDREQLASVNDASIIAKPMIGKSHTDGSLLDQVSADQLLEGQVSSDEETAQNRSHLGKVDKETSIEPKLSGEAAQKTQAKNKELAEASQKRIRNRQNSESSLSVKAAGDTTLDNVVKDKAASNSKAQKRKKISNIGTQETSSELPLDTFMVSNTQESNRKKKKDSAVESTHTTNDIDASADDGKGKKKEKRYVIQARRGRRLAINPADPDLDPKKMTMRDIIRLAETKDRLFRKDEAKRTNGATASTSGVPVQEECEERTNFAPQVQIVDGRIVINQESLTISAHPKDNVQSYRRVEETHSKLNYHSYTKRTARVNWTKEETERFYEGLHEFGTNFAIIQQLFPGRTRKQIFLKYKKEEKSCPLRVSEALILKPSEYMRYGEVMNLMNLQPVEAPETEASQQDSLSPDMIYHREEILETESVSTIDIEPIEDVKEEKESIVTHEHDNLETMTSAASFQIKPDTSLLKCNDKYEEEPIVHRKRSLFSYQTSI